MKKAEIIATLERLIKDNYDEFKRILEGGKSKLWMRCAKEMTYSHNKYGVPFKTFCFNLGKNYGDDDYLPTDAVKKQGGVFDGKLVVYVDIGVEEYWGDVQSHFNEKHKETLCYGSELGGYYVKAVYDYKTGKIIRGRLNLLKWANENVWKWVDWYSN